MEDEDLGSVDQAGTAVTKELSKIEASVQDTHKKLHDLVAQRDLEIKQIGGTTTATAAEIAKLEKRYDQEAADYKGQLKGLSDQFSELKETCVKLELATKEQAATGRGRSRSKTAEIFSGSEAWQNWSLDSNRDSPKLQFGRFEKSRRRKDITGGDNLREVFGRTEFLDIYGEDLTDETHLREYMTVEQGEGYSYIFTERSAFDNGAEFQVEGELKGESDFTFVNRIASACTLAHTSDMSTQQARHTPKVVNFIENEMIDGLFQVESRALLFSAGDPGSFKGIANTDGVQDYARYVSGDTPIHTLRRSITQVIDKKGRPNLFVINHRDWEHMELQMDLQGRFLWVSVQEGGTPRMWKLPVFATPAMLEGKFMTGDFRRGARLIDFERAHVQLFTQHKDNVARNLVTLRAEEEITLAVLYPSLFVHGYLDGSTGSGS